MSRRLAPLIVLVLALVAGAQSHYRYFKEARPLPLDASRIAVRLRYPGDLEDLTRTLGVSREDVVSWPIAGWHLISVPTESRSETAVTSLVAVLAERPEVSFASPVYVGLTGGAVIPTPTLLLRLRDGLAPAGIETALDAIEGARHRRPLARLERAFRIELEARNGAAVLALANRLAVDDDFEFAEPDFLAEGRKDYVPADPHFAQQWGFDFAFGVGLANSDFDCDAPEAWDLTMGSRTITVAIIDDGVQLDHPDLPRLIDGADVTSEGPGNGGPVNAFDSHGTLVAGVIAGRLNNGKGVAGLVPDVRVISARAYVSTTYFDFIHMSSWLVDALDYAETAGAHITNNSVTLGVISSAETAQYDAARANGILHFASSGNTLDGATSFPANLAAVHGMVGLAVNGGLLSFASTGPLMSFSAPAEFICTTDRSGPLGFDLGDYVLFPAGTTFAAAFGSAIAATGLSINPGLTASEMDQILTRACVDIGAPGFDASFAHGFLNAYHVAWQAALTLPDPGARIFRQDAAVSDERFGAALAGLGDVNGDGRADFVVGAPLSDVGGSDVGRLSVRSGASGAELYGISGTQALGRWGSTIAALGDIDGDGRGDFAAGSPSFAPAGRVSVYSGATGAIIRSHSGVTPGDAVGAAIAGLADLDQDGVPDYAIGAPGTAIGGVIGTGRVIVFSGATGALLHFLEGDPTLGERELGAAIAGSSDLDQDGVSDLVVGAPGTSSDRGAAIVFSGADGSRHFALVGANAGERFGAAVAGWWDADFDGIDDVAIGAPSAASQGPNTGGIGYYSGQNGATILTIPGEFAGDRFGATLFPGGDADGDGSPDLLVGAPCFDQPATDAGRLYVFSRLSTRPRFRLEGAAAGECFGAACGTLGDVDGDGRAEHLVGAPGAAMSQVAGWTACFPTPSPQALSPLAAAAGTTGLATGGPLDVLRINDSAGGLDRRVEIGTTDALVIEVEQPPTRTTPANFALYFSVGQPTPAHQYQLPFGLGAMVFTPCTATPSAPTTILLTNNFGPDPCPQAVGSTLTPWRLVVAPLPFPIALTFQGFIAQTPTSFAITNMVTLVIQ